jgi:hypothetical protein
MVLGSEVSPQQPDGGEGHRAGGECLEDDGKVSARASRLDAVTGGVLREPKHLRAVGEERPVALGGEEGRSGVERRQVRDELDRGLALTAGENADAREEFVIGEGRRESESVHTHIACVSRWIWRPREGSGVRQERRVEGGSARTIHSARQRRREAQAHSNGGRGDERAAEPVARAETRVRNDCPRKIKIPCQREDAPSCSLQPRCSQACPGARAVVCRRGRPRPSRLSTLATVDRGIPN